jgi:hypothetical protein
MRIRPNLKNSLHPLKTEVKVNLIFMLLLLNKIEINSETKKKIYLL